MLTMDIRLIVCFLLVKLVYQTEDAERLKICVVKTADTAYRVGWICPQLASDRVEGSQVECVIGSDRFNCLRQLTTGTADFTALEPEDLVAAAAYVEYNILVTNELRLFPEEKQHFEMVAIVHKDVKNVWDINGRRFCHPGLKTQDDWTKAFSTYFENFIIPKQCDSNKTLLENRVESLSTFFESACIAGPWSADNTFDSKLKAKYRNLCASCDDPAGCYASDKYHGREGALLCLTDNVGDIAWVRLDDALEHFKEEKINTEDYNYLCPDITTRPVVLGKPCVWISKPWPVIVARSELAEKVAKMMNSLRTPNITWERLVTQLLAKYRPSPVSTDTLETPEDFLRTFPGFVSANNRATCHPSRRVQWCVASNLEDRKCRWMREASFVNGIEPAISCIQKSTRESCLEAVKSGRADIFVAKPDELLDARKKGLKPIVHAIPKRKEELNRFAAVVKQDAPFKSVKDLKGAKACFAGYKDVGWNAFAATIRDPTSSNEDCSDTNVISNFFRNSCALGVDRSDKNIPYNLYSLCTQAGRAGDDVSAFDCLTSGLGDVAFVNLKTIEKKTGRLTRGHGTSNAEYRTLCPDEIGSNRDDACLLTWVPLSTVVGHENMTDLRREEIYSMLLEMDELFGQTVKGQIPQFLMYGIYDTNHSVIFPEETQHLQFDDHRIKYVRDYNDIVNSIVRQAPCSSGRNYNFNFAIAIFVYVLYVSLTKLVIQ